LSLFIKQQNRSDDTFTKGFDGPQQDIQGVSQRVTGSQQIEDVSLRGQEDIGLFFPCHIVDDGLNASIPAVRAKHGIGRDGRPDS
jgi:hypothetical protein